MSYYKILNQTEENLLEFLRVYGEKNGTEKVIFANLDARCKEKAKRTAAQHGYKVTRVIRTCVLINGNQYGDVDVTGEW